MGITILCFIITVAYRGISGIQNGAYYNQNHSTRLSAAIWLIVIALAAGVWHAVQTGLNAPHYLVTTFFISAGATTWILEEIMKSRQNKFIHFWESMMTNFFTIAAFFVSPWAVIFAIYPGVYLFKGFVNKVFLLPAL